MKDIQIGNGKAIMAVIVTAAVIVSSMSLSSSLMAAPWHAHAQSAQSLVSQVANRTPQQIVYQAEDAYLSGGVRQETAYAGYSGRGYIGNFTSVGAAAIFVINVASDGLYTVTLRYANGTHSVKLLDIYANGLKVGQAALPPTGSWRTWASIVASLRLRTGINTLAYRDDGGKQTNVSLDALSVEGATPLVARGATVPYVEEEAENAATNGTIIGPDRDFTDLASEASGRRAVTLSRRGQYVEFTLTQPANGMMVRYSIPDSSDGRGLTAPLSLYINSHFNQALILTSRYSWFYGPYPFTNNPTDLGGHHFFDEVHTLFHSMLPAGTRIRVQVDPGDSAPSYTIDLADFERVPPPYRQPAGYLSLSSYGADPTGHTDSTAALKTAVAAAEAKHRGLYIPAGRYTITDHIILDAVTVRGAGPWYTVLHGNGVGLYGNYDPTPSGHVQIYDLAIQGEVMDRVDNAQVNGIGGALGEGSVIQNVWIEHTKVGMWFDGPFSDLLIVGCRIRDTTADGINLHDGISNVTVEQTQLRNLGDDGLAMWSDNDADSFDVFRFNTVQLPILANNIAMYGGQDNSITDNYAADTLTQGGGINVGNRNFGSAVVPLAGTITIARNTLVRTGQIDPNWGYGVGALWFYAETAQISARIIVSADEIDDSTQEAIQFTGDNGVSNISFDRININTAATFAFQVQTPVTASMSHVMATKLGVAGIYNCGDPATFRQGVGNTGWTKTLCVSLTSLGYPPPTATPAHPKSSSLTN